MSIANKNYALCIGIGYYKSKVSNLNGTVNDAKNMANILNRNYRYDAIIMRDDNISNESPLYPTKNNIRRMIVNILREAIDGDSVVITYSGHGIQINSNSSEEEIDRKDEAIIPVNYDGRRSTSLTDDEINDILRTYLRGKPNTKVLLIFDCCHSGTVCDLKYTYNYIKKNNDFMLHSSKINDMPGHIICLSGCKDAQVSWGDYIGYNNERKSNQGVMTNAFLNVVKANPRSTKNIFEIIKQMYSYVSKYLQNPQISSNIDIASSNRLDDRAILNGREYLDKPYNIVPVPPLNTNDDITTTLPPSSSSSDNTDNNTQFIVPGINVYNLITNTPNNTYKQNNSNRLNNTNERNDTHKYSFHVSDMLEYLV